MAPTVVRRADFGGPGSGELVVCGLARNHLLIVIAPPRLLSILMLKNDNQMVWRGGLLRRIQPHDGRLSGASQSRAGCNTAHLCPRFAG